MSWVLIDDGVPNHPKFLQAGPAASWLWLSGVAYCRKHHTNGQIPRIAIGTLGVPSPRPLIQRLVEARLWDTTDNGWKVHDYESMYGDDAQKKAERDERHLQKVNAGRSGGLAKAANRRVADTVAPASDLLVAEGKQPALARTSPNHSVPKDRRETDHDKDHPIKRFLRLHEELFEKRTGRKPAKQGGMEAKIAKNTIERFGWDEAERLLREFMATTDAFVVETAGFGLNVFAGQINKLQSHGAQRASAADPARARYGV